MNETWNCIKFPTPLPKDSAADIAMSPSDGVCN